MRVSHSAVAVVNGSLRWFFHEFFVLSPSFDLTGVLTLLCRVLGGATIAGVLYIEWHGAFFERDHIVSLSYAGLYLLLAVMIGNVVKELCFGFCEQLVNWWGRAFMRHGVLLDGTAYREIRRPDGTWMRCESAAERTVWEWTDRHGACHRIVSTTPRK